MITRSFGLGALALVALAACGAPAAEIAESAETAESAESVDALDAPNALATPALQDWAHVEADAYDTLVGSGLRFDRLVSNWGGFGEDGRHRPEDDQLAAEALGRTLTTEERSALEERYDVHEDVIRDTAAIAFDALREALDSKWRAGDFERLPTEAAGDIGEGTTAAFEDARSRGGYVYCDAFTTGGWQVRMVVNSLEHPDFHSAFREMRRAVRARDRDARAFLDERG